MSYIHNKEDYDMKRTNLITNATTALLLLSFCFMLIALSLVGITSSKNFTCADTVEYTPRNVAVEEENLDDFYSAMETLESELKQDNTNVLEQLNKQLTRYTNMLNNQTYNDLDNIKSLIATTENLIEEYEKYENRNRTRAPYHALYTPMIAAAISYFNSQDYILSAELLTHAKDNNNYLSSYSIEHTNVIASSDLFREIANGDELSGRRLFERTGDTIDDDLFFSIHDFTFEKESYDSHGARIIDTYDFDKETYGDGLLNTAIACVYAAQEAGAIIPYEINEFCTTFAVVEINSENNSYFEYCDLYKKEVRTIVFNVYDCTNMNINITGSSQIIYMNVQCLAWDKNQSKMAKNINYDIQFPNISGYPTTVILLVSNSIVTKLNSMRIKITCW